MAATAEYTEESPKFSREDLDDRSKLGEAMKPYTAAKINAMTSDQLDAMVRQAIADGLVKHQSTNGREITTDDTFDDAELVSTAPEITRVRDLLSGVKNRKQQVIRDERVRSMNTQMGKLSAPARLAHLEFMLEEDFRAGRIRVTDHVPSKPGAVPKGGGAPGPGTTEVHSNLSPADRKQLAIQQAYEQWLPVSGIVDAKDKFTEIMDRLSDRKADVERDEAQRKAQAQARLEADKQARIDKAEAEVQRQHDLAESHKAKQDDEMKWGNRYIDRTVLKGQKLPDGNIAKEDTVIRNFMDRTKAEEEHRQFERARLIGKEAYDKEKSEQDRDAKVRNTREYPGLQPLWARFERAINSTTNPGERKELMRQRDEQIDAAIERADERNIEVAKMRAGQVELIGSVEDESRRGVEGRRRLTREENGFEAIALARRDLLNLEPVPILQETRRGITESYFQVAGGTGGTRNPNLVVLERTNSVTGDLISQTIITSGAPIRNRRRGPLPSRAMYLARSDTAREDDTLLNNQAAQVGARGARQVLRSEAASAPPNASGGLRTLADRYDEYLDRFAPAAPAGSPAANRRNTWLNHRQQTLGGPRQRRQWWWMK